MKKIILFALVLAIAACKKEGTGYSITADTQGFEDGVTVYVNTVNQSNRPVIIDSTVIENGKFQISLPYVIDNDFNYLTFKDTPQNVLFLGENYPIKMTVYKDSLRSSIVNGGPENQLFSKYVTQMNTYAKERVALNNQYQIASKLKEMTKAAKVASQMQQIRKDEHDFRKKIAEDNPNSLVAVLALTDLLNLKGAPAKEIKEMFTVVEDSLKTSRLGKNLNQLIAASVGKIDIGSEAEDFSAPNPEGQLLSLKESMGKVTIVDFWASWCKPCRAENPNVVRVYNKYHNKGLNIIGVSLDKNKDHWTNAIDNDNLEWNHVSNLKYWQDPIAKSYGVRSIPATFILDEKGNVIAKNLRGSQLETKISELLGEQSL